MDKNNTKIEDSAVRTVSAFIDKCPKLKSYCLSNDKTPVWDGDIIIYNSKEHNVRNILARVPVQIKGTTEAGDDSYWIGREYIEAYEADRGCVFFMVQEEEDSYEPIRILYAMLSMEDVQARLQRQTKNIKIDMEEIPADRSVFEEELIKFAKKRKGEKVDNPAPEEIASLVEKFKEIEKHLDEVEDKRGKVILQTNIDAIKALKNDGTVGWRDTFMILSGETLDLAIQHIKDYDFLYLQHDLGLYLYKQKLYHLAEDYFVKSLKECRERAKEVPSYKRHVAAVLNNLASLHKNLNRYEIAEIEYQESLEIRWKLAKVYSAVFLPDVAETLNNLANLHSDLNRYKDAESEYQKALEIYRKQAKTNPATFLPNVATTLNNLAILHDDLNRFKIAEADYQEALAIRRKLAKANPVAFLPYVANTLNNLAVLHWNLNRNEVAEAEYQEALEIYRKLAKVNPDAFLPDIAMTLNNLANLYNKLNRYENAEAEYQKALAIRRQLAKANPDAFLPNVASTLNNLAILHKNLKRYENAEAEYQEALEIYREQAKANPAAFLGDIAMTLFNLAILRLKKNCKDEAKEAAEEALDLYKAMAKKAPERWNKDVDDAQRLLDRINES